MPEQSGTDTIEKLSAEERRGTMFKNVLNPMRISLAAFAMLLLAGSMTTRAAELPEGWVTDYDEALELAKKENKPILAVFSTSWCPPCQAMKSKIYPQESVKKALEAWVPAYIDGDQFQALTRQMGVEAYPTFVVLDSSGQELGRFVGGKATAEEFLSAIEHAKGSGKKFDELKAEIEANPNDPKLHMQLGDLYMESQNHEAAIASYEQALLLDKENGIGLPEPVVDYLRDKWAFEEGLKEVDTALEESPEDVALLKRRGDLLTEHERVDEGVEAYGKAKTLDPENESGVHADVAFFEALKLGDESMENMLAAFDKLAEDYPTSPRVGDTVFIRAIASMREGELDKCNEYGRQYLEQYPEGKYAENVKEMLEYLAPHLDKAE